MPRVKLSNFKDQTLLESFVSHLETLSNQGVTFVYIENDNSLILDFPWVMSKEVYYLSDNDFMKNKPILADGLNCKGTNEIQQWEHDLLDAKIFTQ